MPFCRHCFFFFPFFFFFLVVPSSPKTWCSKKKKKLELYVNNSAFFFFFVCCYHGLRGRLWGNNNHRLREKKKTVFCIYSQRKLSVSLIVFPWLLRAFLRFLVSFRPTSRTPEKKRREKRKAFLAPSVLHIRMRMTTKKTTTTNCRHYRQQ